MPRRLRLLLAAALAASAVSTASPGEAGELGVEDVDPIDLEFMIMRGQVDEAIDEANRMLAGLRPTDDPSVMRRIGEVLAYLCEAHSELGQYAQAEAACHEAAATFDEVAKVDYMGEYHKRTLVLPRLALIYEETGDLEAVLALTERELENSRDNRLDAQQQIHLRTRIGDLNVGLARWRAAEAAYLQAIEQIEQIDLKAHWERHRQQPLLAYRNLAQLYWLEERFDDAEAVLATGRAAMEANFDQDHPYLGFLVEAQGWTYFHQGRHAEARAAAANALEFHEQNGNGQNVAAINAKVLMARTEDAEHAGSPEAAKLLADALATPLEDDLGGYLTRRFAALKEFARSEFARHHLLAGDVAEAERHAREAAEALASGLGDTHFTASAYRILARALQAQGRLDESVQVAQTTHVVELLALPPYHSARGETLTLLAGLYDALGQRENLAAVEELIAAHRAERTKFESTR